MSRRSVYINWQVSTFTGWGVYGLNLALNWSADPDLAPITAQSLLPENLAVDPLRLRLLEPFVRSSLTFQKELAQFTGGHATVSAPVIGQFDERFEPRKSAHSVRLQGKPSIAATFFETTQVPPDAIARAASYPLVVTGSTWNAEVLRAHGLTNVRTVIQGIDPTLFHPAPAQKLMGDRFLVFSGGKLERRKGQDIAVAAFRRFAERHADAVLAVAWHNFWPQYARTINDAAIAEPAPLDDAGGVDVAGWIAANGIAPTAFLDLGVIPNAQLPPVLREMDVAIFPNRAEGGTNLVAMECMACGVPTILSRNTGHIDLIEDDNCYPLVQQGALEGREGRFEDVEGWGESDVDELVEALERVYAHRQEARERGLRGAETLRRFTWARTAAEMKALVLEVAG